MMKIENNYLKYSPISHSISVGQIQPELRMDSKFFAPQFKENEFLVSNLALQKGWVVKTLGLLVKREPRRGSQPIYIRNGDLPVLKTVDIQNDWISWDKVLRTASSLLKENQTAVIENELVITSTGEGSWGRVGLCDIKQASVDGHVTVVSLDTNQIDPFYALAYFWTSIGRSFFEQRVRGCTGQTEIYPSDISKIPILIIDPIQSKIIASQIRESLIYQRKSEDTFNEALRLFYDVLGEINVKSAISFFYQKSECDFLARNDPRHFWPIFTSVQDHIQNCGQPVSLLKDLLSKPIWRGVTPQYNSRGEVPIIKTADVQDTIIDFEKCQHVSIEFWKNAQQGQVISNDIIITCTGEGSWGRSTLVTREPAITTPELSVLRADLKKINPYYLGFFFWTFLGKRQVQQIVRGCTGQTHVYPSDLERILIPISYNQNKIGMIVQQNFEFIQKSKEMRKKAIKNVENAISGKPLDK